MTHACPTWRSSDRRVAGKVDVDNADEQILRAKHFCPAQRQGQEQGVAGWHVSDGDAASRRRGFRYVDIAIGERGAADGVEIDVHGLMANRTERIGDALCSGELDRKSTRLNSSH